MITLEKYPIKKDRVEYLARIVPEVYLPLFHKALEQSFLTDPKNASPYASFSSAANVFALHCTVIEKDIKKAKQWFYISELALLRAYYQFEQGAMSLMGGFLPNGLRCPMSDAQHLYPVFASLTHPNPDCFDNRKAVEPFNFVQLTQFSLIQDWGGVRELCRKLRVEGWVAEAWCEKRVNFFEALCTDDTTIVEAALSRILSKESVKKSNFHHKDLPLGRFMCLPGMWYSKLAWIAGHHINIKHPMIISELLPNEPLDQYVCNYDFLIDPVLDKLSFQNYGDADAKKIEMSNGLLYKDRFDKKNKKNKKPKFMKIFSMFLK